MRLTGRSPLAPGARLWFVGAVGELEVAERLRALGTRGEAWRVLHSVPVGDGVRDVDHVVIGPAGVFTLTTENHPGKRVVVWDHSVIADGESTPYLRDSVVGAGRVSILLETALGRPVPVAPLVVVLGATHLRIAQQPEEVVIVRAAAIERHLRGLPAILSVDEVRELTRAALKPRTWHPRPALTAPPVPSSAAPDARAPEALPTPAELQSWFARVRAEVDGARRIRAAWAVGAAAALLLAVVLEAPTVVQGLLG